MTEYHRVGDHPIEAATLEFVTTVAAQKQQSIEEILAADTISRLQDLLQAARNPIRMHGRRVEEMFGYVSASLGAVKAVKREDAGPLLVATTDQVSVPDYRLILADGSEILVEVKNWHHRDPVRPIEFKAKYLRALRRYGELFARPVYVAVYWSRWRQWSLIPLQQLVDVHAGSSVKLSMPDALADNCMYLLGDMSLATVFPLSTRLLVDSERISYSGTESQYRTTIREVEFFARDQKLEGESEKKIVWNFMLFGQWPEQEVTPIMEGEQLTALEFTISPTEPDEEQGFAIVSSLSSLASAQFNAQTVTEGGILRMYVRRVTKPTYPIAGDKYASKALPLWRFTIKPRDRARE